MHPLVEKAVCLLMVAFGLFVIQKPEYTAEKVKALYRQFPEFRSPYKKQFAIRPVFMRAFGAMFIVVGIVSFFFAH